VTNRKRGAWVYRLGASKYGKGQVENYKISVPSIVGERHKGRRFVCELTDDGMLYRLLPEDTDQPEWMK